MKDNRLKHPSYGLIRFSRVSGGQRLFQSPFDHNQFIELVISRASTTSGHWGNTDIHDEERLITVAMSATQFCELITQMNIGFGVPCTVTWVDGQFVESPPKEEDELEMTLSTVITKGPTLALEKLKELRDILLQALDNPKKGTIKEALHAVDMINMELGVNSKFWAKLMTERAKDLKAKVKNEITAAFNLLLRRSGLERLRELNGLQPPIISGQLSAGDSNE